MTVRLTGNTIGHQTVRLHRPDGSIQTSLVHTAQNFNLPIQTLGSTGTYKVVVDPTGANTGNINVQVTSP